jgi:FAD/FMN-containing dehydrogenase
MRLNSQGENMSNTELVRNYDGRIHFIPESLVHVETVEELQAVVTDEGHFPRPLRPMGNYHSLTDCVVTDGTVIDMSTLDGVVSVDGEAMTFTAEAGLEYVRASRYLRRLGLQFPLNVEIGNVTLGAAACCHTKDGLHNEDFGQLSSYVIGMKWIDADGNKRSAAVGDEEFDFMRASHGLAGVIYEVTFQVKPLQKIKVSYLFRQPDELNYAELSRLVAAHKGVFIVTLGDTAVIQTQERISDSEPIEPLLAYRQRRSWSHILPSRAIRVCRSAQAQGPDAVRLAIARHLGEALSDYETIAALGGLKLLDQ